MNLIQIDTEDRVPPEPNSVTQKTEAARRSETTENPPTKLHDVKTQKS